MFIHRAIHDILLFGNTCIPEDGLIAEVDVLSLIDYDSEQTGFEQKFEVKCSVWRTHKLIAASHW